jgi:hypothetical protein
MTTARFHSLIARISKGRRARLGVERIAVAIETAHRIGVGDGMLDHPARHGAARLLGVEADEAVALAEIDADHADGRGQLAVDGMPIFLAGQVQDGAGPLRLDLGQARGDPVAPPVGQLSPRGAQRVPISSR